MDEEIFVTTEYERRSLRKHRVIIVSGEIESGTAHEFLEDMHFLLYEDSKEPITVIIASPGGDAFSGFSMVRAIRLAQKKGIKVIGDVHGHACSMAFFLLQTCDERIMGKLDVLMAHGITTGFTGDMKNMEAESKLLTFWHREWADLVADRCVGEYKEPGFWFEIFRDNTPQWYTAEEAIEMGLVDKIDGELTNNKN
jgi:ATP-dependent Clp protease protease subunit